MPIVIPRNGQAATLPPITEEERDMLWRCVVSAYISKHPEKLLELEEEQE